MVCYEQGIQKILINSSCESSISMRHLPKTSGYRLSSPSVYIFTVMLVSRPSVGPLRRHSFSSADSDENSSQGRYIYERFQAFV